jgi:hypothetical protein
VELPPVEEVVDPEPEPPPPVEQAVAVEAPRAPEPPPRVVAKPAPRAMKAVRAPRPRPPARAAAPRPKPPERTAPPQPVAAIPEPTRAPPPAASPSASEVLERAFARLYDSGQTRIVEIFEHADSGARPVEIFKLARKQEHGRTLSLGVLVATGTRQERRLLSIETGQIDDKRFVHIPDSGRTVNLSESPQLEPFEGSPFRYDDFRPASVERYHVYGQERSEEAGGHLTLVSARPRHRAPYTRVEFLVDTSDYTLLERHYYRGSGLRPYRILQTPRESMRAVGRKVVPMRLIARDLKTGRIAEAKVVDLNLEQRLDSRLFTLARIKEPELRVPNF